MGSCDAGCLDSGHADTVCNVTSRLAELYLTVMPATGSSFTIAFYDVTHAFVT